MKVWEGKKSEATELHLVLDKQVRKLKEQKEKLFKAYSGGPFTLDEYKETKGGLDQELIAAEMSADAAKADQDDLEGLLEFAESILLDPPTSGFGARLNKNRGCKKSCFRKASSSRMGFIEPQ